MAPIGPHCSGCVCSHRYGRASLILLLLVASLLVPSTFSQATDPVHVTPAEKLPATGPGVSASGQAVALHTRPLRVDVSMVLVPVTVTDTMNRAVTSLEQRQFVVFEGDQRQDIQFFAKEDGPISIGVLLDLSKSMYNKIDMAKRALAEFFATAHPDDDYFVITFADSPAVLADSTRSVGTILAKLADVKPQGRTSLLDAIYLGVRKLKTSHYKRRALLIISDGADNHSRYRASEIKDLVAEADVQIYGIGIFDSIFKSPEEWSGQRLLTSITDATGGRTITLKSPRQLPDIAAAVGWELRNQYVLGYRPTNSARDGKWRNIKVRLTPQATPPDLQVHYKRGYTAPLEIR